MHQALSHKLILRIAALFYAVAFSVGASGMDLGVKVMAENQSGTVAMTVASTFASALRDSQYPVRVEAIKDADYRRLTRELSILAD